MGMIGLVALGAACDDALAALAETGGGFSPVFLMGLVMAGFLLLIPFLMAIFCTGRTSR